MLEVRILPGPLMEQILLSIKEWIVDVVTDYILLGPRKFILNVFKRGGWVVVLILILLLGWYVFRNRNRRRIRSVVE